MDNIQHLIEVLKSQVILYNELLELIVSEKSYVISWSTEKTVEINKKKEELIRREHVLEEARKVLLSKISSVNGLSNMTLSKVINIVESEEEKEKLLSLGDRLLALITNIHTENLSLRILYTSNNRIINDFYTQIGIGSNKTYGSTSAKINTFRNLA